MNGIKLFLALAALVSIDAGAATASSEGTQPVGVPVYTLHGNDGFSCRQAWINPATVEVWRAEKASDTTYTFKASCPAQAVAEGIMIEFHALHGSQGSSTHGGGFLYAGSATDFRADLANLR